LAFSKLICGDATQMRLVDAVTTVVFLGQIRKGARPG
jgi:hypothetical protein